MRGIRALLAAALVILLALIVLLLHSGDDATAPAPAGSTATAAPPAPPAPVLAQHAEPARSAPPIETAVPQAPPPIELPPDTERLTAEFVPGTTEWEEVPMVEGSPLTIRFLPAHYNVIAPQPIVLYLEVVDTLHDKRLALATPHVRIRPFDHEDQWYDAQVVDDGTHRYVATLAPTGAQQTALFGHVVAEGVVESKEGGIRRIPQGLIYTLGPRAHLTGRWRDEAKDGHLYLSAEIEVEAPGMFTLMAQLVGPNREPIALTRTMQQLETGTHWLTMRVWGKAIRDAGVAGPYEVRNVLLTRDMNERGDYDPGPTILSAHKTAAYTLDDFSPAPYVEPPVAQGEQVGPDSPSQRNNPPPLHSASERIK